MKLTAARVLCCCALIWLGHGTTTPAAEPDTAWWPAPNPSASRVRSPLFQHVGWSDGDSQQALEETFFESEPEVADAESDAQTATDSSVSSTEFDKYVERLESLEENWTTYQDGLKEKSAAAKKKPTFDIGGRIHLDYWGFPDASEGIGFFEHPVAASPNFGTDPEDTIVFRRIRLETEGDILETMLWRVQVDFNNPSTPELKDCYIGFKELPFNQVLLIGNQKRPLGLDHLNSSRYNVFLERPFVVEAFNEDARRLGVAMYGYSEDEVYTWRYGVYNLENISTDGRYLGDNLQPSLNARLSSSPWYDDSSDGRGYFHWAVAGMAAWPEGRLSPAAGYAAESRFRTRPEARALRIAGSTRTPSRERSRTRSLAWRASSISGHCS